ncbi:uncharacterized protein LOC135216879 [Macrobrachium nipponense]|uniref:uncharacterized protein LOC135216879 n=1 Tax=Macrobrachium nipponense TaxID=159736 RepID=UPI0030C8CF91
MASYSPKECGICLKEFDELKFCPKILPCSHNMCGECLDKMIRIQNKFCPFCRRSFQENSLQSFGTNFPLLDALKCLKEVENKQKTTVMNNLDEGFKMIAIDDYQNNKDPRDYTVSSYQRNRCESPHWRGRNESFYQQDMSETPNHKNQSDSPYQRNRDELLQHRSHSESSHQRYNGEPPYQRDQSESSHQRYRRESPQQGDLSESFHQRYNGEPPYQRDQNESSHHRYSRGPPYQRDQSELSHQRYRGEPTQQRDQNESPNQKYSGKPLYQSESSHKRYSELSYQKDQSESSDHSNRSKLPYMTNCGELHHQEAKNALPCHRYRGGSPDQRNRGGSHHTGNWNQTHHKNPDEATYRRGRGESSSQIQGASTHLCPKIQEFTCIDLLTILINAEDFSISTQMIKQKNVTEPDSIHRILADHKHVFEENDGKISFKPEIKICSYHISTEGCHDRSSCSKLHICPNYIFFSCPDENCILGHNIKSGHNQSVLQLFLMNELSSQQLPHILSQVIPQSTSNPMGYQTHQEASKYCEDKGSMRENFQNIPQRTLWHDDYEGNTEIPEICYYSVTNKCSYEITGCKRLHADTHFHWQVKERGIGWVNLRKVHVEALEKAYCNPSQDTAIIPTLNKNNCQRRIFNLLGSDKWEVNFKEMSLRNGRTRVKLSLRRITSQKINGNEVATQKYIWYFQDRNNQWVQYGKTDTTLGSSGVSSLTSDELEREYQKDPSNSITFHIYGILYILDFNTMVQMNTATNVRRNVKRRPMYHAKSNSYKKCM